MNVSVPQAPQDEALGFIVRHGLMGRGIGYVDVHLLASVILVGTARLWTRDKRLSLVAREVKVTFGRS